MECKCIDTVTTDFTIVCLDCGKTTPYDNEFLTYDNYLNNYKSITYSIKKSANEEILSVVYIPKNILDELSVIVEKVLQNITLKGKNKKAIMYFIIFQFCCDHKYYDIIYRFIESFSDELYALGQKKIESLIIQGTINTNIESSIPIISNNNIEIYYIFYYGKLYNISIDDCSQCVILYDNLKIKEHSPKSIVLCLLYKKYNVDLKKICSHISHATISKIIKKI
jgi:hypothetical protein